MWGSVAADGVARVLRFERDFPRPPPKVWAALVTPARLSDWMLADAEVEPHLGGRFTLAFRNGPHRMHGTILRWDPPRLLEYTWPEAAAKGASVVRWDLAPNAGGCRLTLTHTLPHGGEVLDFCSGWHWHLDALEGGIDGLARAWSKPEWQALREDYAARLPDFAAV